MGGSFNPPTLAHYLLMKEAIDAVDADIGLFIPVSDAYLRRKMNHSHPPVVLPPEMRVRMLQAMCTDSRMAVCQKEIGTIKPQTSATMQSLQSEYPDADIYFVMGDDKLELLASLAQKRDFLRQVKVILFSRRDAMTDETIRSSEMLSEHPGRILTLKRPREADGISSTIVRSRLMSGEECKSLMHPGVWALFKQFTPADFPDAITRFSGEYDFLNNRYSCRFVWEGQEYNCAESAFQASKCQDESDRKFFSRCSADKASAKGNEVTPSPEWELSKVETMASIISEKFSQNAPLREKLLRTRGKTIVYGNNRHDTFWGVDLYSWQGDNQLGKILMNVRNKEEQT